MQPDRFRNERTIGLDLEHSKIPPFEAILAVSSLADIAEQTSVSDYMTADASWVGVSREYYETMLLEALQSSNISTEAISTYDWDTLAAETLAHTNGDYFSDSASRIEAREYDALIQNNSPLMESLDDDLANIKKFTKDEKVFIRRRIIAFIGMTGIVDRV